MMIGRTLSHYEVTAKLGEGGMGEVYCAKDSVLGREVAIKILGADLADEHAGSRLLQEARSASALNHPNVCTIHEVGEHEGRRFIVMERVPGLPLSKIIPRHGLPVETLLRYATQIAGGLAHAHECGVIHRDLKSANVMVTPEGRIKVLDFGLAIHMVAPDLDAVTESLETLADTGTIAGTLPYLAPEILRGQPASCQSDIWALGILLHEMALGEVPFQGTSGYALTAAIVGQPVPDMPSALPATLRTVILRCLAKEPGQRYHRTGEVQAVLEAMQAEPDWRSPGDRTLTRTEQLPQEPPSVVVLPFANLSPDPENEHFSDGLTEEIITDLSMIRALRVISRQSAMQLKGTDKDPRTIGRELNVRYVLEGSVRRSGQSLRITAQLVDAERDTHLWANKYRGTVDDVFHIQEQVSRSIVDALRLELSPSEDRHIADRAIDDVRAYECYQRATQEMLRFTMEGRERALELIRKARELVGDNELLYAAKGYVDIETVNVMIEPDETYLRDAEECVRRIFEINPNSAHGHYLTGAVRYKRGNVQEALVHLKRAHDIDSNNPKTLWYLAGLCGFSGKATAARSFAKKLLAVDPLTSFSQCWYGWVELLSGDFGAALEPCGQAYRRDTQNPAIAWTFIMTLVLNQRMDEAFEVIEAAAERFPETAFSQHAMFLKHALEGDRDGALQSVTPELTLAARWDEHMAWAMGDAYALLDERDEALRWLEHGALDRGFINYPLLSKNDPLLENVRKDERFQRLMKRVRERWERLEV